jgi:hypothetical protein
MNFDELETAIRALPAPPIGGGGGESLWLPVWRPTGKLFIFIRKIAILQLVAETT